MSWSELPPRQGMFLRLLGDPILTKVAQPVVSKPIRLGDLLSIMRGFLKSHRGLGLAAPQIGVSFRVIVVQLGADREPRTMLNPEIVERSTDMERRLEGCLSIPGFQATINRSVSILVRFRDEDWEPCELRLFGIDARVVQHEVDHLDGRLIIDGLSSMQRKAALRCADNARKAS